MALHRTPAEHTADPPSSWTVAKTPGGRWALNSSTGETIDTFTTKRAAEEAKTSGFYVSLFEKEGRWFAGEAIENWKPYTEIA
jgi:hypothetical protein